ncbi:sensor histidine kinase [Flavobacterium denitrificans]|uniref:sensor histidine kinase n=1 Tax=Flavobacterium denitrificans TaxID=281361 RepID=UPI0003FF255F|nr:sensor histidine kinase [Flavobacterium denitrificans]
MRQLCLLFFFSITSSAQLSPTVSKYDLPKKRYLIKSCANFLYGTNQGAIDVDSSVVLASKAYKLPASLAYDEGYNDGSYLIGQDLIDKGNISQAKRLLASSKDDEKIKLLLQLGSFYLFKPGTKPKDLQNAFFYIKDAVDQSNKLKIKKWQHQSEILLGRYYFQANNEAAGKKYFEKVIDESRKVNDKITLAYALECYGNLLTNFDPKKEKIFKEVSFLYESLGLEEKRIDSEQRLSTIYFWTGRMNIAKKRFYKDLIDLRKIGFTHQQFTENTIAFIELYQHNNKSALYYALKSVKRMEDEKDFTLGDITYLRLGDVYNTMGYNEEALEMFKKSIEVSQNVLNNGFWYQSIFSAIDAMSDKGKNREALDFISSIKTKYPPTGAFDKMMLAYRTAVCYKRMKNFMQTEKYFKEMDYYATQLKDSYTFNDVAIAYTEMALFYAETNRLRLAEYYTNKVFLLGKIHQKKYNSDMLQLLLCKTDSLKGNYKEALAHFQNYKNINDSISNNTQNKQIEELKIAYETKNKEQKIILLGDQSKLQERELQKSQLLNTVSIWSLVLLLLVIGLLFNRYRVKQRTNIKLEQKEKEINQKNSNLSHLLDEKEWLLKEIHHRVKNNLQTVISLLNSQSAYLDNDKAISAIKNSQNRIHSMSLIHQKLYSADNVSTINMQNYIKELVAYLKESFSFGQRVRFEIKIDPLELDVVQAVPIGLILNEAITNSLKYAFPDEKSGIVAVSLQSFAEGHYQLIICDNGIGIDTDFTNKKADTFGMSLIKGLTDDIDGNFTMENNNGTILKIDFKAEFPITKKYGNNNAVNI